MNSRLTKPIIFTGNGRSGSTMMFELFSTHEDLGWISNYSQSYPSIPQLNIAARAFDNNFIFLRGETKQHHKIYPMNRFFPRPTEGWPYWENFVGEKFSKQYLTEMTATTKEVNDLRDSFTKILKYQGKKRLTIKVTGPTRIEFLHSIFPDAHFIHTIRDGRAVVNSLMKVDFWAQKGGFDKPFWTNGFKEEYEDIWLSSGKNPIVLAALQWKNIIEIGQQESKLLNSDNYTEIRYEDFMKTPHDSLSSLFEQTNLCDSTRAHSFLEQRIKPSNMNYKFKDNFDKKTLDMLNELLGDILVELGYEI